MMTSRASQEYYYVLVYSSSFFSVLFCFALFYSILFFSILFLLSVLYGSGEPTLSSMIKCIFTSLRSPDRSVLCESAPSSIHETFPYAKKVFRVNSEIMNGGSTSGTRNHHGRFIMAILPSYLENSLV